MYTEIPVIGVDERTYAGFVRWSANQLYSVLIGTIATISSMYLWQPGLAAWVDKTGNLHNFEPTEVYQIDRDSMGTA